MKKLSIITAVCATLLLAGCRSCHINAPQYLKSWNTDSYSYKALVNAVENKWYRDKIAVFDFDGTLFCERDKTYFDWIVAARYVQDNAEKFAENDIRMASKVLKKGEIPSWKSEDSSFVYRVWKGASLFEYRAAVSKYMGEDMPGFVNLKRRDALFKPMLEVIDYLHANGFKVFVCTGTDRWLVRTILGGRIPNENIIGSTFLYAVNGKNVVHCGDVLAKNLDQNKILSIWNEIGNPPSIVFGNSSGDYAMATMTRRINWCNCHYVMSNLGVDYDDSRYAGTYYPVFMVMCDDTLRDMGNIEDAESVHSQCLKNKWIPISVKNDWKTVYGDDIKFHKR